MEFFEGGGRIAAVELEEVGGEEGGGERVRSMDSEGRGRDDEGAWEVEEDAIELE